MTGYLVCTGDMDGNYTRVNDSFKTILGYSPEEIIGRPFVSFIHPDDVPITSDVVEEEMPKGDQIVYFENRFRCKDGTYKWLSWTSHPDPDAGVSYAIAVDITERKQAEEALRQYEIIVFNSTDMMALLNRRSIYMAVNPAYAEAFDKTPDDLIGRTVTEVFGEDFFETVLRPYAERCLGGEKVNFQESYDFPSYGLRYKDVTYIPYLNVDDEIVGFVVNARDITERKQAEAELQTSEERYRLITEKTSAYSYELAVSPNGIVSVDWVDGEFTELTGYDIQIMSDLERWLSLIHQDDMIMVQAATEKLLSGEPGLLEYRLRAKDGREIWLEDSTSPTWDVDEKHVTRIIGTVRDITERKQVEQALRDSEAKLVALSSQLVTTQEEERRHIAQELHDEIGQEITAVSILLGQLQDSNADRALGKTLNQVVDMVNTSLQNIRDLAHELHPSILDDLGLVPALRWLFKRQAKIGGFSATIDDAGLKTRLAPNIEIVCFRIVQEALTNILKYAHAKNVELILEKADNYLHIKVHDDGVGFDVDAAMQKAAIGGSMGLLSMEERASMIGGMLEITSELSEGTLISGRIPLTPTEQK